MPAQWFYTMVFWCNMLTLLKARPCSSKSRTQRVCLHRIASMPFESLLPLKQESEDIGPRKRLSPSFHTWLPHLLPLSTGSRVQTIDWPLVRYTWRYAHNNETPLLWKDTDWLFVCTVDSKTHWAFISDSTVHIWANIKKKFTSLIVVWFMQIMHTKVETVFQGFR
jgi:hypothetical protein